MFQCRVRRNAGFAPPGLLKLSSRRTWLANNGKRLHKKNQFQQSLLTFANTKLAWLANANDLISHFVRQLCHLSFIFDKRKD